ncbi:carboxypeptidase Y precursor [Microthyrium microscopicum]|uniref:Carboxypeptidase n=1 Tax=Microthyrium microscopicum TaxID=703497 RepID=A0A6A6UH81_9PEZI|nr:carboxypeptidase Y precursor [Microthyrium microscopicum]
MQYTGWLDVGPKHFFFWYHESESSPENDPLVLWLTGGPGGSSMIGMMEEMGPCRINGYGNGTNYNEYAWNKNANVLFIDQPAGVGFSYLDKGEPIPSSSFSAGKDIHKFLQIFVSQTFPQLRERPFHISGESYGGHYIPVFGTEILNQNANNPSGVQINLKSVFIGNGYVSPKDTTFGYWETLCTTKPGVKEPVFNTTRCDIIATNLPRCVELIDVCNKNPDPAICTAAENVCWTGVVELYDGEAVQGGRNRFDITAPCEMDDLCYRGIGLIDKYLNQKDVWQALGVPDTIDKFNVSSSKVENAFVRTGETVISTTPQVQNLLAKGVDVMFYQGNLDLACNTAGNYRWANNMPWKGQAEFSAKDLQPWSSDGKEVGTYKEVRIQMPGNDKKTLFTFLTVDKAGHMVPLNKPEVALDLMTRWIQGKSFS